MKNKIEDLKSVIREFSNLSQKLLHENNRLNDELDKVTKDHEREISGLKQAKDEIEKAKSDLEGKYNTLLSSKDKVKKKKEELIEDNKKLDEKIRILENQLKESNNRIENKLVEILEQIKTDDSVAIDCITKVNSMMDMFAEFKQSEPDEVETEKYDENDPIIDEEENILEDNEKNSEIEDPSIDDNGTSDHDDSKSNDELMPCEKF